jgi:signal transduction histidine kinase/CheY-like chemotaxis protein
MSEGYFFWRRWKPAEGDMLAATLQREWLGAFVLLFLCGLFLAFNVVSERDFIITKEKERLSSQVKNINELALRNFSSIEGVVKHIKAAMQPASDQRRKAPATSEALHTFAHAMQGVNRMTVIDKNGVVIAASVEGLIGKNFSERNYFKSAQQLHNPDAIHISAPFVSSLGDKIVNLVVPLLDRQGRFNGVLSAVLSSEYFGEILASARYADDMSVAIVHEGGDVFVSKPKSADIGKTGEIVKRINGNTNQDILVTDEQNHAGEGLLAAATVLNSGQEKTESNLIILAVRSRSAVLSEWAGKSILSLILYAALALLIVMRMKINHRSRKKEKIRAEKDAAEIKSNERFLKTLIDALPGLVGYWDLKLENRFSSKGYLEWFNKTPEQMKETSLKELLGNQLYALNEPYISKALKGEGQVAEHVLKKADGSIGYTLTHFVPDGVGSDVRGIYTIVNDVTRIKEAEFKYRDASQRLQLAAKAGRIGIWEWTIGEETVSWDERMREIYEVDNKKIPIAYAYWRSLCHKDDIDRVEGELKDAIDGKAEFDSEFRALTAKRNPRVIRTAGIVVKDSLGKPRRVIGINWDATQLREHEKLDLLGQLSGGVAHDINNFLGAIKGFARFISDDSPWDHPNRVHADKIIETVRRARNLIDQIKVLSRNEDVSLADFSLSKLALEAVELYKVMKTPNIELEVDVTDKHSSVRASRELFLQAIINMCVNAQDSFAGKSGTIRISVGASEKDNAEDILAQSSKHMIGTLAEEKNLVELTIEDNGCGMSEDVLEKIFQIFYTTKSRGHGTGLGLSTVQRAVQTAKGRIIVQSREHAGTRFICQIPLLDAESHEDLSPLGNLKKIRLTGTVLLVEDDPHFLDMMMTFLERYGLHVAPCSDAQLALDGFLEDPAAFDMIISDYMLPGMYGTELLRHAKKASPDLSCILMTGNQGDLAAADLSVADAVFFKPFDMAEIQAMLARYLKVENGGAV